MNQKTSIENLESYVIEKAEKFTEDNFNFECIDVRDKRLLELAVRILIIGVINDAANQAQETMTQTFKSIEVSFDNVQQNAISKLSRDIFESGSATNASEEDKLEHVADDLPPSVGGGSLMAD